jgi:hypothetical protein
MARSPSSIRFPEDLRNRVAERAAAERRTFSGEVLLLFERAVRAGAELRALLLVGRARFRFGQEACTEIVQEVELLVTLCVRA